MIPGLKISNPMPIENNDLNSEVFKCLYSELYSKKFLDIISLLC